MTKLLLTPLAWLYIWLGRQQFRKATPVQVGIPVICIGNLTLGGAGKTPVATAVRRYFAQRGLRTATLSRGYRGSLRGVHRVDPVTHMASETGDEPLMLAKSGESWISKNRPAGALAMEADGVKVIVMDDGHQNHTLRKSLSIIVVDASNPFGNGHVFPKGPLRERIRDGLARADAIVMMGDGPTPAAFVRFTGAVLRARLAPIAPLPPGRYVAFAGIGRPERFFDSLQKQAGVELAEGVPFPDHHTFTPSDLAYLSKLSSERDAVLVTTDKDFVRLPHAFQTHVVRASVEARFDNEPALATLLERVLS